VITGFGQKGVTAEAVAESVVREVRRYLAAGVPVGEHLADQLLVPLAMAGKGTFRTVRLTRHASTNMKVIEMFLDVRLGMENLGPNGALIWIDDSA
jgi:RNA 3'-terminal phosphate cyclase (ATP)